MDTNTPTQVQKNQQDQSSTTTNPIPQEKISLKANIAEPANPVSGGIEMAPVVNTKAEAPKIQEVVTPSEQTPELPKEVKEAGVEVSPSQEVPNIPKQVQEVTGIKASGDAVPVPVNPSSAIQLPKVPVAEADVSNIVKTHPVNDAIRWIAILSKYVTGQARKSQEQPISDK